MAFPIALLTASVALVIVVSVVGHARKIISPETANRAIDQELTTTVDALSDAYALNELLRLKREALEATGTTPHRMASLMRDIHEKIGTFDRSDSAIGDDDDPQGGSTWK